MLFCQGLRLYYKHSLVRGLVRSILMMLPALVTNLSLLTAPTILTTTAPTLKMPGLGVVSHSVLMEILDWLVEHLTMRDEWKFATLVPGAQSVMIFGAHLMQWWCVTSLDILQVVMTLQPVDSHSSQIVHP